MWAVTWPTTHTARYMQVQSSVVASTIRCVDRYNQLCKKPMNHFYPAYHSHPSATPPPVLHSMFSKHNLRKLPTNCPAQFTGHFTAHDKRRQSSLSPTVTPSLQNQARTLTRHTLSHHTHSFIEAVGPHPHTLCFKLQVPHASLHSAHTHVNTATVRALF